MHDPLYIGSFGLIVMINKNEYLSCCTSCPFSSVCCILEYSDCKWMFPWFIEDWLYPVLGCFLNLYNITVLTNGPKLYRYHTEVRFHWNKTWPRIVFIMLYETNREFKSKISCHFEKQKITYVIHDDTTTSME